VSKECPNCGNWDTVMRIEKFQAPVRGRHGEAGTTEYYAPVYDCPACHFLWTDFEKEDAEEAAVKAVLEKQ